MAIPPGFLDELRNRVSVSEIVGKRVKLIKKGREHSGLCPFHSEKSPSFTVNDDKGFYHCFGCGAHGSALDFVMNTEGLNFPEAVERLAIQAGMDVPQDTPEQRERTERRNTLYDVMEQATLYYERALRMPEGQKGLAYLRDRGLTEETIKRFRLGYSPNIQGGLKAALKREGIEESLMIEAGLLIQPDDRGRNPYERFRERVMFPITDRRGKVIAFGGRILGDGKPKYLNSPDTPLFHKGTILYGLAQARESAHKKEEIIVTEGYMDVIGLAQGGFPNAVAPLGTALTEEQIQLLWRMSKRPTLCFDGDAAGQRAASRGAERALPHLKPGYGLQFVHLPTGEDPDSLIKAEGSAAMQTVLDDAIPLSELLWRTESEGINLETAEDRALLEDKLKKHAFQIEDESVKSHFLSALKDRMWKEIRAKKETKPFQPRRDWKFEKKNHHTHLETNIAKNTKINAQNWRETLLLAAIILHPSIMDEVGERLGLLNFSSDSLDKLRQEVLKTVDGDLGLDSSALQGHLIKNGFSGPLNSLLGKFHAPNGGKFIGHETFLHPDRPIDDVLRGWDHTFNLYVKERDLAAEFKELKRRLEQEMTPQALSQFQAHQKLMGMVDTDEDDGGVGSSFKLNEEDLFD
ncbi:DNA primase [Terasakiella sp. A23]|uniref:DNA primase n=1 Tax=Terasakiella sp. FCG-A23 TaxID=3080561 RepID=UPI0029539EB5|nr:DNA primase [Terasakiella sp. A23]MDV7340935.1 DNA primase [Terasakiella sp. A23]